MQLVDASYDGEWELPALGQSPLPPPWSFGRTNVAWVGDRSQLGLADALTTWFGPPAAAAVRGRHT